MFPIGLQLDFFEKKQKNLSYMEPFNLDTEKEIFYKSGQRSVVNHLINQFNIQQEN